MIIYALLACFVVNGSTYCVGGDPQFKNLEECQGYAGKFFGPVDEKRRYRYRVTGQREDWFQCASKRVEVWEPR